MTASKNTLIPLIINHSEARVPRAFVIRWVGRAAKSIADHTEKMRGKSAETMPLGARELTVVFLGTIEAQAMNFKFRRKNYATDILSFPSDDPTVLGELIICPDVVRRQSREHGHSYQLELGYMLIHGILHLLGYDHENGGRRARVMYEIQDEVFEKLRASKILISKMKKR